jgi:hypothetical protein
LPGPAQPGNSVDVAWNGSLSRVGVVVRGAACVRGPRAVLLALPLLGMIGCAGCDDLFLSGLGVPFTHAVEDSAWISFGAVGDSCDAEGTKTNDRGTVTYDHRTDDDGTCALWSSWEGIVVDIVSAKADAVAELQERGIDGSATRITFTKAAIGVGAISIRDDDNDDVVIDVDPAGIHAYRAAVDFDGEEQVILLEHEGDADPLQPIVTVTNTPALVESLNEAWQSDTSILGAAWIHATVDPGAADSLAAAEEPGLDVEIVVTLEGVAGF